MAVETTIWQFNSTSSFDTLSKLTCHLKIRRFIPLSTSIQVCKSVSILLSRKLVYLLYDPILQYTLHPSLYSLTISIEYSFFMLYLPFLYLLLLLLFLSHSVYTKITTNPLTPPPPVHHRYTTHLTPPPPTTHKNP